MWRENKGVLICFHTAINISHTLAHNPQVHNTRCAHTADGVEGASLTIPLTVAAPELPPALTGRWPHLAGCTQLAVPQEHWDKVCECVCV